MDKTTIVKMFANLQQQNSNNPSTPIGIGEYYLDSSIMGSTNMTSSVDYMKRPLTGDYNVNTNGTLESNYGTDGSGKQLDEGFKDINDFYTYLAEADGNKKNGISEETFDNLYYAITGKKSTINFSVVFGGDDNIINNAGGSSGMRFATGDFWHALAYLDDLDTKDVFNLIEEYPDYSKQKNYFQPVLDLQVKTLDFTMNADSTIKDPATQAITTEFGSRYGWHKYVNILGIPIFADKETTDKQLIAIGKFVNDFLEDNEDIRQQWIKNNHKFSINAAAKGGAAPYNTTIANSTDPRLFFHEMLHNVDYNGFRRLYPEYTTELMSLYENAKTNVKNPQSPWFNKPVWDDSGHFLITLVVNYYDMGKGAFGNTDFTKNKAEFQTKFPKEYAFIKKYFGESSNLKLPKSWV